MKVEKIVLNEAREVSLTAYLLDTGGEFRNICKRPAVLILPGGGYQFCSEREADPVAMPYLKAGYQAFILRYSVGKHSVWPNPLQDYEQAMEMIRTKAEEWKIFSDKIAVIGFSAGGHLAAAAATMSENRPNAAILGYPVTGSDVKGCCATAPDTIPCVDKNTCPCFIFATRTDAIVPVMNSIRFMEALVQADISFESHIYSYGPHGFSTCDTSVQSRDTIISSRVPNWVSDSIGWLKEVFGDFGNGEMTKPVCKAHVTDNDGEFLSVDCTFGYVMGNPEGRKVVEGFLGGAGKQEKPEGQEAQQMTPEMMSMASGMKMRQILEYAHMPEEVIEQVNDQLSRIPNQK